MKFTSSEASKARMIVAGVLVAAMIAGWARADIINVPGDHDTIQEAIEAAHPGDEVVVAEGEYFEHIDFLGKAITVRSTDPEDPEVVGDTIINGDSIDSVVKCTSGEGPDTVLSGLTITNGYAEFGGGMYMVGAGPTITACRFVSNHADYGGGMLNHYDSNPIVIECTFCANHADYGGGMWNGFSDPEVTDCIFEANAAGFCGGGMWSRYSEPLLTDCLFVSNSASETGGGMYNWDSAPTAVGCTYWFNTALTAGAVCNYYADCVITECEFIENMAIGAWPYGDGGAISNESCAGGEMLNCILTDNAANEFGGGVRNYLSATSVTSCTFAYNTARYGGGLSSYGDSGPLVTGCTFVENTATSYTGAGGGMQSSGNASVLDCTFRGNTSEYTGGGLSVAEADNMSIANCSFEENHAGRGGGLNTDSCEGLLVLHCVFSANSAADGGGMSDFFSGRPTVMDCTFRENSADIGGAMLNLSNSASVVGCLFDRNRAATRGGGLYNTDFDTSPVITSCEFTGNTAGEHGGAVCDEIGPTPTMINCIFKANMSDRGGALYCSVVEPAVINCLFVDNIAEHGRALGCDNEFSSPSEVKMSGCILWDGGDEIWNNDESDIAITYSCIQGGYGGVGNIDADPMFADPENGDFHLSSGSPCIDAGVNNALPADDLDLDDDGDIAERVPLDLDGNPRFADDPETADSGCGAPVIVDMGAYEYHGDAWHPMRIGDIDGNGAVNTADLLALLGAWGGYEEGCVLADLDYSGAVDAADLLMLLGNWG